MTDEIKQDNSRRAREAQLHEAIDLWEKVRALEQAMLDAEVLARSLKKKGDAPDIGHAKLMSGIDRQLEGLSDLKYELQGYLAANNAGPGSNVWLAHYGTFTRL